MSKVKIKKRVYHSKNVGEKVFKTRSLEPFASLMVTIRTETLSSKTKTRHITYVSLMALTFYWTFIELWLQVCIVELGGTVGDIEGRPYTEAFRPFSRKHHGSFCVAHVSYVPQVKFCHSSWAQVIIKFLCQINVVGTFPTSYSLWQPVWKVWWTNGFLYCFNFWDLDSKRSKNKTNFSF